MQQIQGYKYIENTEEKTNLYSRCHASWTNITDGTVCDGMVFILIHAIHSQTACDDFRNVMKNFIKDKSIGTYYIMQIINCGQIGNQLYFVTERPVCITLKDYLTSRKMPLSESKRVIKAVQITSQILTALSHAHKLGTMHGSLGLHNVFLLDFNDLVRVCDFGIYTFSTGETVTVQNDLCAAADILYSLLKQEDFTLSEVPAFEMQKNSEISPILLEWFRNVYNGKFPSADKMNQELQNILTLFQQEEKSLIVSPENHCNYKREEILKRICYAEKIQKKVDGAKKEPNSQTKKPPSKTEYYKVNPTNNADYDYDNDTLYYHLNPEFKPQENEHDIYPSQAEYTRLLSHQYYDYLEAQNYTELTEGAVLAAGSYSYVFYTERDGEKRAVKISSFLPLLEFIAHVQKEYSGEDDLLTEDDIKKAVKLAGESAKSNGIKRKMIQFIRKFYKGNLHQAKREWELYRRMAVTQNPASAKYYPEYSTPEEEIQNELNKLEHEDYIPSPETSLSYVILETELGVSYMCYISWLLLSVDYKKHVLKAVSDIFAMLENLNHTMIHCDIKPHNVILVKRNGKFVPVCIDFNVSHFTQNETGELTEMQKFLFTPEYKPPEGALIRNGNLEYKTDKIDVYSAGVMAYEMLNGFWFSRHMKEQWQKVQMPYYYDKLELTNEKRSQLENLIRSCLQNVSRKRPDARTVADKYAMLARTDEELYQDVIPWQEEDEGERLKRYVIGIRNAVLKVPPAFRSLTDGSQFSAGEQTWLYPDKEEFLRLAVQQMDRDFIVTDAHSAIGVYSPKEGKKKNRLIMQYLFLLDREDAEQKLRETSAEINASVQLRESCFNIVEIYPEYSTPLNLIQKAINGEKGSLPFVLKGMELGLVYTNYMKWLFSNQNHYREYVLEAVKDVLGVVKSLHDAGAVHGNICSDNIMLVRRGNRNVLVLTNFRNSIRYEPKSVREDIYQMGLLIYELLDGKCYPDKTKIPVGKKTSFVSSKANLWQRINLVRNPLDELLAMCLDREKYPDADEDALSQKLREAVK